MSDHVNQEFEDQRSASVEAMSADPQMQSLSRQWFNHSCNYNYSYNFNIMGRPIIQYPQDIVVMQELIWEVKPDLIVETGIAHGGSLIASAMALAMLDYTDAVETGSVLDPATPSRRVLGIDIDIRSHNRAAIEAHPLAGRIDMIQGSSIAEETIQAATDMAAGYGKVMVILDSNHTHDHVLAELEAYAPLVSSGSYCVVYDTVVEDMSPEAFPDRPWGVGDNPKTAVWEYMKSTEDGRPRFEVDRELENKLLVTVAPDGYLRRVD